MSDGSLRREILAWLRSVFRGWVAATTGGGLVAVVGTYVAISGPRAEVVRACGWLVFGAALVTGLFRAWQVEYRKRSDLDSQVLALGRAATARPAGPRLSLRFDPDDPLCDQVEGGDQRFRVQVLNDGDQRAEGVSVVLDDVWPPNSAPRLAPFSEREKGSTYVFSVPPSRNRPPRYVDVLLQRPHPQWNFMRMVLVKNGNWLQPSVSELRLTLRIEADVAAEPLKLSFSVDSSSGRMRLTSPAPPT